MSLAEPRLIFIVGSEPLASALYTIGDSRLVRFIIYSPKSLQAFRLHLAHVPALLLFAWNHQLREESLRSLLDFGIYIPETAFQTLYTLSSLLRIEEDPVLFACSFARPDLVKFRCPSICFHDISSELVGGVAIELADSFDLKFKNTAVELDCLGRHSSCVCATLVSQVEILNLGEATYHSSNVREAINRSGPLLAVIQHQLICLNISLNVAKDIRDFGLTGISRHIAATGTPRCIGSMLAIMLKESFVIRTTFTSRSTCFRTSTNFPAKLKIHFFCCISANLVSTILDSCSSLDLSPLSLGSSDDRIFSKRSTSALLELRTSLCALSQRSPVIALWFIESDTISLGTFCLDEGAEGGSAPALLPWDLSVVQDHAKHRRTKLVYNIRSWDPPWSV